MSQFRKDITGKLIPKQNIRLILKKTITDNTITGTMIPKKTLKSTLAKQINQPTMPMLDLKARVKTNKLHQHSCKWVSCTICRVPLPKDDTQISYPKTPTTPTFHLVSLWQDCVDDHSDDIDEHGMTFLQGSSLQQTRINLFKDSDCDFDSNSEQDIDPIVEMENTLILEDYIRNPYTFTYNSWRDLDGDFTDTENSHGDSEETLSDDESSDEATESSDENAGDEQREAKDPNERPRQHVNQSMGNKKLKAKKTRSGKKGWKDFGLEDGESDMDGDFS